MKDLTFRIGRFPVSVKPVFWLTAGVLALSRLSEPPLLLSWIAVVFLSVLVHELGHAIAFSVFGHRPSIELHMMGGHTSGSPGLRLTPKNDVVVSLAGPFLGFALGGLVFFLRSTVPALTASPFLTVLLSDLLWVNIGWGVMNLLPVLPLDGGRVLVAALRHFIPGRASELAYAISSGVALVAAIAAALSGMMYAALLAGMFGVNNWQSYQGLRSR